MHQAPHPTILRRQLEHRRKKLGLDRPALAASMGRITKVCGRLACRCYRGEKHEAFHVTCKVDGKTRAVYVPVDLVAEVRSWIDEHRRLKRRIKEMSELAISLIRNHVRARKRRQRRS